MRLKLLLCAAAFAAATLFTVGIAVGQRSTTSKFERYFRPASPTQMDLITLATNLQLVREQVPPSSGVSIPELFFNYQTGQPEAVSRISPDFESASLDNVKRKIIELYYSAYYGLRESIPELSEDQFTFRINRYTADPEKKLFAECRNGKIVIH